MVHLFHLSLVLLLNTFAHLAMVDRTFHAFLTIDEIKSKILFDD